MTEFDNLRCEEEKGIAEEVIELKNLVQSQQFFIDIAKDMRNSLDSAYDNIDEYAQFLTPFVKSYCENQALKFEIYETKEIEEMKQDVEKFKKQEEQFNAIIPSEEIAFVLFDNTALKEKIKLSPTQCLNELQKLMPQLNIRRAVLFTQNVQEQLNKINLPPTSVEQFVVYMDEINNISQQIDNFANRSTEITSLTILIDELKIKISEANKQKLLEVTQILNLLRKKVEDAMASYDQNLNRFRRDLEKMIPQIENRVKELQDKLYELPISDKKTELLPLMEQITLIRETLDILIIEGKKISKFQINLQVEVVRIEKLEVFSKEFSNIERLWKGVAEWKNYYSKWLKQHFLEIDLEEMQNVIERLSSTATICSKELEQNEVAKVLKQDIEDFKATFILIQALKDPALTENPWNHIREVIRLSLEEGFLTAPLESVFENIKDPLYTIDWMISKNLFLLKDKISEIALKASKEAELVKMIEQVEWFWRVSYLNVTSYKDNKDVSILGNNDDLIGKIDDTLLQVNNVLSSRFVEGIRHRVENQARMFRYLQELIDEWILHQRNWLYLEPILNSPYSAKNLVKETKIFQTADTSWKKIMKQARDNPSAKRWADDINNKTVLNTFKMNNQHFEGIQKALDDFLEKKREHFQRFFFLSNDELLEILSAAKNIKLAQPFLRKCFENIVKLDFDKMDNVTGMISAEGEVVPLRNYQGRIGEVEEWLKSLEEQMKYSLKVVMRNSLFKYE